MNIEQLVHAHLELIIPHQERWLTLLAEDAIVEFPYAGALGFPTRLQGHAAIQAHFARALTNFTNFTLSQGKFYPTTDPEVALAEAHGSAIVKATGQPYEQDYVMLFKAHAGRIVLYREYWNPLIIASTFAMAARP